MVEEPSWVSVDTIHGWKAPCWEGHCHDYLKYFNSRWAVEEGNLSNGLRDCLPK
jgi:hypothetical protein